MSLGIWELARSFEKALDDPYADWESGVHSIADRLCIGCTPSRLRAFIPIHVREVHQTKTAIRASVYGSCDLALEPEWMLTKAKNS